MIKPSTFIIGSVETREVFIDNQFLNPKDSQKICNHSPDGFSWGYAGSGPAQLALAIMLYYFAQTGGRDGKDGITLALELYQDFKRDIIATQPTYNVLRLTMGSVDLWVHNKLCEVT